MEEEVKKIKKENKLYEELKTQELSKEFYCRDYKRCIELRDLILSNNNKIRIMELKNDGRSIS